ncbi:uncharacterized protein B0T23DRAFT_399566 [Neurospora hispaniola]|uniref:Uncharacterized protein n=1 Tax=Neurospora hispaniola TaxID=588809 RepID=A0AAJ0HZN1_9PEZI|nr:hypothetical protein B0T23DRAFT_399566 [Neurospora hispaniola]
MVSNSLIIANLDELGIEPRTFRIQDLSHAQKHAKRTLYQLSHTPLILLLEVGDVWRAYDGNSGTCRMPMCNGHEEEPGKTDDEKTDLPKRHQWACQFHGMSQRQVSLGRSTKRRTSDRWTLEAARTGELFRYGDADTAGTVDLTTLLETPSFSRRCGSNEIKCFTLAMCASWANNLSRAWYVHLGHGAAASLKRRRASAEWVSDSAGTKSYRPFLCFRS